ncbi:MAG: hypothetical protein ACR2JB_09055 [Bryobacteraceae bacterium]
MRIKVAAAFVIQQPQTTFAAIAASVTALTDVIAASVLCAEDTNITRAFTAD